MTSPAGVWAFDADPASFGSASLPDGSRCSFDGRLDEPASSHPAGLALALYRGGGAARFRELIGDWSLVLWDASSRALLLASDYAGVRPLYFQTEAGRVRWSSSIADLALACDTPPLDERYAAAFLSLRPTGCRTPYRGIEAVPPGCAVRIAAGGTRVERFWDLPAGSDIRLKSESAYDEAVVELFTAAVRSRTQGHARVCCELSGGLDSSTVSSMALRLHVDVNLLSYTHPGAADEPYIRAVEQAYGVEALRLDVRDAPFVAPSHPGGAAPGWWEPRYCALARRLDEIGATALLTGQMGDFAMGNVLDDSEQTAALLRSRRWRDAAREAYGWSQALRVPIYPVLWRAARMAWSSWAPGGSEDLSPVAWRKKSREDSIAPRLRAAAEESNAPAPLDWRSAAPDRRRRFRALTGWLESRRLQAPEPLHQIDYCHPFADRRLIEFLLAIPPGVLVRPGEPRRLMRRAFAAVLPEPVRQRQSKASFGTFYDECVAPLAQEMLREPHRLRSVEMGLLERDSLLDRLRRYLAGADANAAQLRVAILFEYWLRSARYR